ncbi:MAG: HNH endonuclease [Bradymonadales bacterium]|nr:MAG: HNH endonuclease [Bradymonadales bacterium]
MLKPMKDMNSQRNSILYPTTQKLLEPEISNLQKLGSDDLLSYTQKLAASERKIYAAVIEALEEIERRKLYLAKGYSSLFLFCTEVLRYSAGAAQRRIESMRLIKNFPMAQKTEVKVKLQRGNLSLSHLSRVSKALRSLPPQSCHEKMKLLSQVENTTQRECERKLIEAGVPGIKKREDFRAVSESSYRLSVTVDEETKELLEKFMGLTAHQNPWASREKALKIALKLALQEVEKRKFGVRGKKKGAESRNMMTSKAEVRRPARKKKASEVVSATEALSPADSKEVVVQPKSNRSRHIPRSVRAEVWERDGGACVFVEPDSGRACGSSFGLEWDHVWEFSRGGDSSASNLRLLCRRHNNGRQRWERESSID